MTRNRLYIIRGYKMGFSAYLQVIINGILTGGLYGLMSCAWSFQCGALRYANFAYGACMMVTAYLAFYMVRMWNIPVLLMILLVLAINAAIGLVMRNAVLKKSDFNTMIVCTMGVELIMTNLVTLFASATPRDFALTETRIFLTDEISIGSIQLLCFVLSLVLLFAFQAFLQKTWMGKAIRAVVQNSEVATTMGIKSERIMDAAFSVSFLLIGIASMLLALLNQISPTFGTPFQSKAFMVCVLAGIGNLGGTFFSGILVGVATALIGFVVGTEYLNPITYALFVLILLVRPNGLFTKASSVARKL